MVRTTRSRNQCHRLAIVIGNGKDRTQQNEIRTKVEATRPYPERTFELLSQQSMSAGTSYAWGAYFSSPKSLKVTRGIRAIRSGRRGVTAAKSARSLGPTEPRRRDAAGVGASAGQHGAEDTAERGYGRGERGGSLSGGVGAQSGICWVGAKEERGEGRRVSGEGQGGGLSAGTRSRVPTPTSSLSGPRDPRGGLAGGAATPWDPGPSPARWGPCSPGTGGAAAAAEPSLSGDRAAAGPLASAAAATGVDLAAQEPQATTTLAPAPRPHLPCRERAPCPRAAALAGSARHPAGEPTPWNAQAVSQRACAAGPRGPHSSVKLRFSGSSVSGAELAA